MNKLILINGDSYTAKGKFGGTYSSYSEVIAKYVGSGYDVKNIALPGSSNARILKSTIEHILRNNEYTDITCIVGYSFITSRIEIAHQSSKLTGMCKLYYDNDYGFPLVEDAVHTPKFMTHAFLPDDVLKTIEKKYYATPELSDVTLAYANWLTNLYMLKETFKSLGISYFIFSAAYNNMPGDDIMHQAEILFGLHNENTPPINDVPSSNMPNNTIKELKEKINTLTSMDTDPDLNHHFIKQLRVMNDIIDDPNIDIYFSVFDFAKTNNLIIDKKTYHLQDDHGYITIAEYILDKLGLCN